MPATRHNADRRATPATPARVAGPAVDLREVRIALIRNGSSLSAWAKSHGYRNCGYMHQIISGKRRGRVSLRLLSELKKDTGL